MMMMKVAWDAGEDGEYVLFVVLWEVMNEYEIIDNV